jgi:hypothetical protein
MLPPKPPQQGLETNSPSLHQTQGGSVDHDTGRLVWAAPGRDKQMLRRFFDALGEQRSARITHVSADAAGLDRRRRRRAVRAGSALR